MAEASILHTPGVTGTALTASGPVLVQGRVAEDSRESELPRLQAAARSVRAAR